MDKFSADSLRFLLLSSPVLNGEDFALHDKDVGDVARKLSMIWNMYDFFTMYAEVDDFTFPYKNNAASAFTVHDDSTIDADISKLKNPLDIWIISRLHQVFGEVEKNMDAYNLPDAMAPILPFLDDASNWFVRRSRRRFWKSDDDGDKDDAYKTLHYVLVRLSYLLAPFTPFLAEELYRNMTGDTESIHLKDWPESDSVNQLVLDEMATVRSYVNEGLALRAKAGLKVRQPLLSITVPSCSDVVDQDEILEEELNVKEVILGGNSVAIDENITPELKREGQMREIIRFVQSARKKAGLQVDDRIILSLKTDDKTLQKVIDEHQKTIYAETLTEKLALPEKPFTETAKIDGATLEISLQKA